MYVVITFRSRNDALSIREVLSRLGIGVAVIDTPRQVTSSCGLAIKVRGITAGKIKNIIYANNLANKISAIYEVHEEGNMKRYIKY